MISRVRAQLAGQWYELTLDPATGRYEGELIPPATSRHQPGGAYSVTVEAINDSGASISADGSDIPGLRLTVLETTKPVLQIAAPAPGYLTTARPRFVVRATDENGGSGIDPSSFDLILDGVPASGTVEAISGGYQVSWTPAADLAQGPHTILASVSDLDGNRAEASAAWIVDTIPPALSLEDMGVLVDIPSVVIAGASNDATSAPVTVEIKRNGASLGLAELQPDGTFSMEIPLELGENTVTVSATDGAGLVSSASPYFIRLVTDRTQADLEHRAALKAAIEGKTATAEQIAEWNGAALKGAYNHTDLNRVGHAVGYLEERLTELGALIHLSPVTDWTREGAVYPTDADAYLSQVSALRGSVPVPPDTPQVPADLVGFGFEEANAIELILLAVEAAFPMMEKSSIYSGEAYAGEF